MSRPVGACGQSARGHARSWGSVRVCAGRARFTAHEEAQGEAPKGKEEVILVAIVPSAGVLLHVCMLLHVQAVNWGFPRGRNCLQLHGNLFAQRVAFSFRGRAF